MKFQFVTFWLWKQQKKRLQPSCDDCGTDLIFSDEFVFCRNFASASFFSSSIIIWSSVSTVEAPVEAVLFVLWVTLVGELSVGTIGITSPFVVILTFFLPVLKAFFSFLINSGGRTTTFDGAVEIGVEIVEEVKFEYGVDGLTFDFVLEIGGVRTTGGGFSSSCSKNDKILFLAGFDSAFLISSSISWLIVSYETTRPNGSESWLLALSPSWS